MVFFLQLCLLFFQSQFCLQQFIFSAKLLLYILKLFHQIVQAREIEYCIRESLDNLQLVDASVMLDAACEGDIEIASIIAAYDFYESLVEKLLDKITAVMVRISCKDGTMKMNLQIGCSNCIEKSVIEDIRLRMGSFTYTNQEEDVYIDVEICGGGVWK